MTILGFDTSTPIPSFAVVVGGTVVAEDTLDASDAGRRTAEHIHLTLGRAGVSIQDIDQIVVGVGPGGFTGIRIGIATALALGQATTTPVVGVCSLDALARGLQSEYAGACLVPVIDARRHEVFAAAYRGGSEGPVIERDPRAVAIADFAAFLDELAASEVILAGNGVEAVADAVGDRARIAPAGPLHQVRASCAIAHAQAGGGRPVTPMYLRLPDAEVNRRARESSSL